MVSDDKGHYAFPAAKLEPGHYTLSIRAGGYEPAAALAADVGAAKPATADIKLQKATKKLASQLSNGEWMMSVPGSDQQKMNLTNCVSCHTVERIVRSTHNVEEFAEQVLPRMARYANQSMPIHPQVRQRRAPARGARRPAQAGPAGAWPSSSPAST